MYDVKILVNGKEIRLKDFPRKVAYNIILGYINSLNLEEIPKEISINVKVQENSSSSHFSD